MLTEYVYAAAAIIGIVVIAACTSFFVKKGKNN